MPTNLSVELSSACSTLFGPDITPTPDFLSYLQPGGLKAAFRKRALESHPDRIQFLGISDRDLHSEFINVQDAYEILLRFINNKPPPASTNKTRPRKNTQGRRDHKPFHSPGQSFAGNVGRRIFDDTDFYYSGRIPGRKLLFGEYLYYSGVISWRTLIEAVTWQRMQRPRLGQIAIDKGLLSPAEVMTLLKTRPGNTRFGSFALMQGYLDEAALESLLAFQRLHHHPIGTFFIRHGAFSLQDLFRHLTRQSLHNRNAEMAGN